MSATATPVWQIVNGDCAALLPTFEADSFDALLTDPPAGIGFMGKEWDGNRGGRAEWVAWLTGIARECLRVLKPGAHGLVWALPRTSHWTATALEDAGWEIRDVITHHFGSGFPKSHDVSKAIDKAAGAGRSIIGVRDRYRDGIPRQPGGDNHHVYGNGRSVNGIADITAATTDEAKQWNGWGTALKPASEHWILIRKPLIGTVVENVLRHGTGALNIDACRVETQDSLNGGAYAGSRRERDNRSASDASADASLTRLDRGIGVFQQPSGRWPANLVLSHAIACETGACSPGCPIAALDEQSGVTRSDGALSGDEPSARTAAVFGKASGRGPWAPHGDSGGASRFFYCAKPATSERDAGLGDEPRRSGGEMTDREDGSPGTRSPRAGAGRNGGRANIHPTVKPVALMRWLCRLITPPGGRVLDPFAGSGTTVCAALQEGCAATGIEREPDYHRIATKRVAKLGRTKPRQLGLLGTGKP